ncbi:hypothetical protein JCM11641_000943 [Rhodosporidiobolus odoratus]
MTSLEDFDRIISSTIKKGKLGSSVVQSATEAAVANIQADSHLVSTLFRQHKKASAGNKLVSLYLIDAIAREVRSKQKKLDKEGKGKPPAAASPEIGSTTPSGSPAAGDGASKGDGSFATFLKKLEALLGKILLDNWENGKQEHREKVRKVLDIWIKASTFSSSALLRINQKLLAASSSSSASRNADAKSASPARREPSPSPGLSPPREPTSSSASAGPAPSVGGSAIPANVLALLAASSSTPPSAAALEQTQQDNVESEVERVLREARGEPKPTPSYSQPPPSQAPYSSSSYPPPRYEQPSHSSYPPQEHHRRSSYPSHSHYAGPPPNGSPGVARNPSRYADVQRVEGKGNASRGLPGEYEGADSYNNGGNRGGFDDDEWGAPPSHSGYNNTHRPQYQQHQQSDHSQPPPPPFGQNQQRASYEQPGGNRGQVRSYDDSFGGGGGSEYRGSYKNDTMDQPPTKKPFEPAGQMAQPSQSASSSAFPRPQQQQQQQQLDPVSAPPETPFTPFVPPPPPVVSTPNIAPIPTPSAIPAPTPASATPIAAPPPPPEPFNPTTFTATTPTNWTSFHLFLRTSHPYFASLPRPPNMDEMLTLCAPSAWMSLGQPRVAMEELGERERKWVEMVGMAVLGSMQGMGMVGMGMGMQGGGTGTMGGTGQ